MAKKEQPKTDDTQTATDDLQKVVERARQGDREVLPELRKALDENPDIWQAAGDLAKHAEATWIRLISKGDLLIHESIQRELDRRRQELAGEDPTPMEKQLVDRIIACWLALQHAELMAASMAEHTLPQREHYLKRLDAAERRHTAAVSQLTKVRELLPRKQKAVAEEVTTPKKPARQNGHAAKEAVKPRKAGRNRMNVLFGDRELVSSSEN